MGYDTGMDPEGTKRHIERLRRHRNRPEADCSLQFMQRAFKNQIEKPYKQLGEIGTLWAAMLPEELVRHTRLVSLTRGQLHVAVSTNTHLYQLDRLLRQGLQDRLISSCRGKAIRRIQLRVDAAILPGDR